MVEKTERERTEELGKAEGWTVDRGRDTKWIKAEKWKGRLRSRQEGGSQR